MGESGAGALGDRGRHPCSGYTGDGDSSGSEPFLYILELPLDIHSSSSRRRRDIATVS